MDKQHTYVDNTTARQGHTIARHGQTTLGHGQKHKERWTRKYGTTGVHGGPPYLIFWECHDDAFSVQQL